MTTRPLTRAEIALHEMEWQARELFGLAIATIQACGHERPACVSLARTTTFELLRLSIAHGAAEQRVAGRNVG